MHTAIYWFGFFGAWLLFAGPIHQATTELGEESDALERLHEAAGGAAPPSKVSTWWWLLPPVRLILASRKRDAWQKQLMASMPEADFLRITHYVNVARGWFYVAGGAWLIALKETYELVESHEWATWLYVVLCVAMTLIGFSAAGAASDRNRTRDRQRRGGPGRDHQRGPGRERRGS